MCILTLGTIDVSCLVYLQRNSNKLSIKYQSYPKSVKIDEFGEKICISHKFLTLVMVTCFDIQEELRFTSIATVNKF